MMEFLDKIYGYEHFGIILFAVIMLLVVLFVVILLLGKKDEKKREFEKTQALEKQNLDTFKEVNEEPVKVEVQENFEPILAETPKEELTSEIAEEKASDLATPLVTEEPVFESVTPVVEESATPVLEPIVEPTIQTVEEPIMEPVVEQPVAIKAEEPVKDVEIPNFNFDELAASIAKELSALEKLNQPEPTPVEEAKAETNFEMSTPVVTPIENEVSVTPIDEVVKPNPRPVTFSSVYINKPAEPVKEAVVEPVAPVALIEPKVAPMPHPSIELPKPAEMPILKDNSNEMPKAEPNVPDFSQFEGESYNLK